MDIFILHLLIQVLNRKVAVDNFKTIKKLSEHKIKLKYQFDPLFYVSDQLRDFYRNTDLGPEYSSAVRFVTQRGIATPNILITLFARYIKKNNLKNGNRFLIDENMINSFNSCEYLLNKEKIAEREINFNVFPMKYLTLHNERIENSKQPGSVFERLGDRIHKYTNEPFYEKEKGVINVGIMIINNTYRIPNSLLTDEEYEKLNDPIYFNTCNQIRIKLNKILK